MCCRAASHLRVEKCSGMECVEGPRPTRKGKIKLGWKKAGGSIPPASEKVLRDGMCCRAAPHLGVEKCSGMECVAGPRPTRKKKSKLGWKKAGGSIPPGGGKVLRDGMCCRAASHLRAEKCSGMECVAGPRPTRKKKSKLGWKKAAEQLMLTQLF